MVIFMLPQKNNISFPKNDQLVFLRIPIDGEYEETCLNVYPLFYKYFN